jgi:hypothetical protein
MKRRYLVAGAAALVALFVLVLVGRWERGHRARVQVDGMERVLETVGPLDNPSLTAFRYFGEFQCLVYRRAPVRLALELCFDRQGRLIEAIDRRSGNPHFWSLRDDPTRSTIRVDRREVDRLLLRMGVPQPYLPTHPGGGS